MKRYLMVGVIVFIIALVVVAPAGLLTRIVRPAPNVNLIDARGSVWRGQARLLVLGGDLGTLNWSVRPTSLLTLGPTFDWRLAGATLGLSGETDGGFGSANVRTEGAFGADMLNPFLEPYDIHLNGRFEVTPTSLEFAYNPSRLNGIDGQINWSGGSVRFTLANQLHEVDLPPMSARLTTNAAGVPNAVVVQQGDDTPLMVMSVGDNGFVKIGITKMFTKLLRNPWPGSDPDHAVVLEVEEQLL